MLLAAMARAGRSCIAMAESLVGLYLGNGPVYKQPWEDRKHEYVKVHGDGIKQGNFSNVWRARYSDPDDGSQRLVVIKEVQHRPEYAWQEEHELECIRRVNDHPLRGHFIKLLNVFHDVDHHIIVMESGICSLMHIQLSHSGYGISTVQTWMQSLARAVWACHEVQVMHRDIKPANCIMCLGQQNSILELKLADFGNSAVVSVGGPPVPEVSFALEWCTTPQYSAPELFIGNHTFKGDVWSVGVICSELLHTVPGTS